MKRAEIITDIISRANAPLISRKEAAKLTGGLMAEKTIANLDCLGEGPSEKIRIGKRVGYPTAIFAEWFAGQSKGI